MDDIRKINYKNKLDRRAKFSVFLKFITKNWVKMLLVVIVISLIFFPEMFGSVVGEWFNKLVTSFVKSLTF